jgi:hypothetical protein
MDPNAYTIFTKYHTWYPDVINQDYKSFLASEERKAIIYWFFNLTKAFPNLQKYLEKAILLLDKIPSILSFEPVFQKVLVLSILQVCAKLDNFVEVNKADFGDFIEYLKDDISPYLSRTDINMSEVYLCNQLDWDFSIQSVNSNIKGILTNTKCIYALINKDSLKVIISKILYYSLYFFNQSILCTTEQSLVIVLLSIDQIDLSETNELRILKLCKDLINNIWEKVNICLRNIKWLKDRLYENIISTQEYPIVIRYSDRILNEYKDNLKGNNSYLIGKSSFVNLYKEMDFQDKEDFHSLSFTEDLYENNFFNEDMD